MVALLLAACGSGAPSGAGDTTGGYMTGPPPGFTTEVCDTDICEGCNPVPEDPTKKILLWGSALDQYLWDIDNETFEYVPADFTGYGCAFEDDTIIECTSNQDCYDYCDQYQNGDCPEPLVITDPLLDCVLTSSAADLFCTGHTNYTNAEPFAIGGNVTGGFAGGGRTGIVAFDGVDTWMNTGDSTTYTLWYPSVTTLPDGRVLVFGGDYQQNSTGVYNPSTGSVQTTVNHPTNPTAIGSRVAPSRPSFPARRMGQAATTPSSAIGYDAEFEAEVDYSPPASADETGAPAPSESIARATVVRLGSVTHQFDMDQRLVELDVTDRTGDTITLRSPLNANVAPPGWYMLFLLADSGVPSEAAYVLLQ